MQYWSLVIFKHISNVLGTYLEHDQSYETIGNMTMACFLVHMDTREGMEERITLHWRHFSHRQNIDYEGVPFRYKRCHKARHLYKEFPLLSPSSPPASKGMKYCQTEYLIVDEQPTNPNSPKEVAWDIVQEYFSSEMSQIFPPMTRSRSAMVASPITGIVSSPFSSTLNVSHNIFSLASSASTPCMVTSPITCALDPPFSIFSTTSSAVLA